MLDVSFSAFQMPSSGGLALVLGDDALSSSLFQQVDTAAKGALSRAVKAESFEFAKHKSCVLIAPIEGLGRIVLVGLGKKTEVTSTDLEEAGGIAAFHLKGGDEGAVIAVEGHQAEMLVQVASGAYLRSYSFDLYKTEEDKGKKNKLTKLVVQGPQYQEAEALWPAALALLKGIEFTRNLVSEPGNILTPPVFAQRVMALQKLGLEVEILDEDAMEKLGFGALLGVAQGSQAGARTVIMNWKGGKVGTPPLAFIGKGVTFDSGGISIKPASGMEDMKWDMAGAGTVCGLMAALAGRKAQVNAVGVIGLVENMPSGTAQRPGDVIKSYSGQTIEVLNTDAEGRLVLADILAYAARRFSPKLMVDLATLTGAIIISLGHERAGLFSNTESLAEALLECGEESHERLWRMPLGDAYDKLLQSDIADMKNIGGRAGGSITAAQFLQRFVGSTPWAHLDIAGTAWATKTSPIVPKGASGFGVRLLDRFVKRYHESL
ncbi:leucyl aminopeptidase [Entomobacter blattae]|uniref:Probable cytosol aminopeptidase n=1 Tax=Entomobacter blattae TaxID=2762277 RepID=A0A7H1NV05_9PROT|nr:leucyl aminopeptidase [Entomobacter blattae]QNT79615.1 Cytosol aminopeptidase [Entomobacter blattae]